MSGALDIAGTKPLLRPRTSASANRAGSIELRRWIAAVGTSTVDNPALGTPSGRGRSLGLLAVSLPLRPRNATPGLRSPVRAERWVPQLPARLTPPRTGGISGAEQRMIPIRKKDAAAKRLLAPAQQHGLDHRNGETA